MTVLTPSSSPWLQTIFRGMALLLVMFAFCSYAQTRKAKQQDDFEPELISTSSPTTMPISEDGNLQWRVVVLVNDEPGLFALDTGATRTLISREYAAKLGVLPSLERERQMLATANHPVVPAVKIRELRLGDYFYSDFRVPVQDLSHINRVMKTKIDGIIGMNVLGLTRCDFDFRKNTLVMDTSPSSRPTNSIPIKLRDHRMFVSAKANGKPVEFEVDTGSYSTCATTQWMRRLKLPPDKMLQVDAPHIDIESSAHYTQTKAVLDALELCGKTRRNVGVMEWDNTVLGMDLLQLWRLSFDARGQWLLLTDYP